MLFIVFYKKEYLKKLIKVSLCMWYSLFKNVIVSEN